MAKGPLYEAMDIIDGSRRARNVQLRPYLSMKNSVKRFNRWDESEIQDAEDTAEKIGQWMKDQRSDQHLTIKLTTSNCRWGGKINTLARALLLAVRTQASVDITIDRGPDGADEPSY